METVNIIGAGLAGLSAAIRLAEEGCPCRLISAQASERAQSVLAEGGINGALNTMGEQDSPAQHAEDTLRAGCDIADPEAVSRLAEAAPDILRKLIILGVPFQQADGHIRLRNFGGQKKKRTAYARSSTGKALMTALIDEARRYEAQGLISRYEHHTFRNLRMRRTEQRGEVCSGVTVQDGFTGALLDFPGPVIAAWGGLGGFFPGRHTGTTANTGEAAAIAFAQGVRMGNLEMIQFHPTTIGIAGKRCLVSEAARGEGGRLCVRRAGNLWYFMEEKYPEMGNLMPRDVVSREMFFVSHDPACDAQVYLDLRGIGREVWRGGLSDLREELMHYLHLDPAKALIPVEPGIHYFMGGIDVDAAHRTNIPGLLAAGECCLQYHGANRLGGNSMLGAIVGGKTAAETLLQTGGALPPAMQEQTFPNGLPGNVREAFREQVGDILFAAMGIVRDEETLLRGLEELGRCTPENPREEAHRHLAEAMIRTALCRRESRGAQYRRDYPDRDPRWQGRILAVWDGTSVRLHFVSAALSEGEGRA